MSRIASVLLSGVFGVLFVVCICALLWAAWSHEQERIQMRSAGYREVCRSMCHYETPIVISTDPYQTMMIPSDIPCDCAWVRP